jgi:hypothetical protein
VKYVLCFCISTLSLLLLLLLLIAEIANTRLLRINPIMGELQMSREMQADEGYQWHKDAIIMKEQGKHPTVYGAKIHKIYFPSVLLNNSPYRNVNFK